MSNSNFPFYNDATFGITSFNQFELSLFNPYSLYYYTVSVVSPVFPAGDEEDAIETPDVTFQDFLDWCGSFVDIQNEEHALYRLAVLLLDVASDYIDVQLVGQKTYKRAVCYYAGHYLEMHLKMLKDEANTMGFNPENKDKKIEIDVPMGSKQDFKQTIAGQLFWSIYGTVARFAGDIEHSIWGGH